MYLNIPEIKISVSFDKKVKKSELYTIRSSSDTADLLRNVFSADTFDWTEEFVIICMNRANKVVGFHKVASGGFSGVVADPKVILTVALQTCSSALILAHNHPSGNLKPSRADEELTRKIKSAAALLDITVLDHIILSDQGYYSFADEGTL